MLIKQNSSVSVTVLIVAVVVAAAVLGLVQADDMATDPTGSPTSTFAPTAIATISTASPTSTFAPTAIATTASPTSTFAPTAMGCAEGFEYCAAYDDCIRPAREVCPTDVDPEVEPQSSSGDAAASAITTSVIGESDSDDGEGADDSGNCTTITDIVCNDDNDMKALCEMIQISDLDDDFNEEMWTVFAPKDASFERLGRSNLDSLVFGTNSTVPLTSLLLFHVIPNVAIAYQDLPCAAGSNLIEMGNGKSSRTMCVNKSTPRYQKGEFNVDGSLPEFVETDIQACNGVIHVIDQVMLDRQLPYSIPDFDSDSDDSDIPGEMEGEEKEEESVDAEEEEEGTITDGPTVSTTENLSTTESLSASESLSATTDAPSAAGTTSEPTTVVTIVNGIDTEIDEDGQPCQSISTIVCGELAFSTLCTLLEDNALLDGLNAGLWTVFAPTNAAFNTAPPITDIENVLLGHTVSNELIPFEDLECTIKTDMTNGKYTRTVCDSGVNRGRTYQKGLGNADDARPEIIDINIPACNGIIHVVSEVILF